MTAQDIVALDESGHVVGLVAVGDGDDNAGFVWSYVMRGYSVKLMDRTEAVRLHLEYLDTRSDFRAAMAAKKGTEA